MAWHPEVLASRQLRVLTTAGPLLSRHGFYLAGGTAVALHLGHRRSVDFDWFTSEGLDDPLQLAEELRADGLAFVTEQVAPGTLHGSVQGVRVSLLRHRSVLLSPVRKMRGRIRIASRIDLAAFKLAAVAQRGSKKDFVDVYALGKRCFSLQQMMHCYRKKFATQDIAHLLYSLSYFDDANRERMPSLLWRDLSWRTVKETIRRWVREAT